MKTQLNFVVADHNQLAEKVINYFTPFGFTLVEQHTDKLRFRHSSSLLDAWKTNPLSWGSEILVSIAGNAVSADFSVDTAAQLNTKEEATVWQQFIKDFQNHLTNGDAPGAKLYSAIADNKKSRGTYWGWAVLGALTGALLSFAYNQLTTHNATLSLLLIPVLASTFLAWGIRSAKVKKVI